MKITVKQRECYRHTSVSAEVQRPGRGSTSPDFARLPEKTQQPNKDGRKTQKSNQ
jgi:hypothetical protein